MFLRTTQPHQGWRRFNNWSSLYFNNCFRCSCAYARNETSIWFRRVQFIFTNSQVRYLQFLEKENFQKLQFCTFSTFICSNQNVLLLTVEMTISSQLLMRFSIHLVYQITPFRRKNLEWRWRKLATLKQSLRISI